MAGVGIVSGSGSGADAAMLLLRIAFGAMIVAHGYNKIWGAGGIAGTAQWFAGLGLHPPVRHAWLAALTEIGSGVLLLLGLVTPVAAAALAGLMVVAAMTDHRGKGFFVFKGGWEYVAMTFCVAVTLAMAGPGRWSLDEVLGLSVAGWAWGLAVAAAGCVSGGLLLGFGRRPLGPTERTGSHN